MTGTSLFLSIFFGCVGIGYFMYGRRRSRIVPLVAGFALCVFPYFVSNTYAAAALGLGLVVLPFLVRV